MSDPPIWSTIQSITSGKLSRTTQNAARVYRVGLTKSPHRQAAALTTRLSKSSLTNPPATKAVHMGWTRDEAAFALLNLAAALTIDANRSTDEAISRAVRMVHGTL